MIPLSLSLPVSFVFVFSLIILRNNHSIFTQIGKEYGNLEISK